jgi:UrcA family protein
MNCAFRIAAAVVSVAVVATSAFASPSSGDGPVILVRRVVHYRIAELHDAKGAKNLALRIKNAADYVCGGDDIVVRWYDGDFIPCREQAIDRALATLNAPMVSAALRRTSGAGLSSAE